MDLLKQLIARWGDHEPSTPFPKTITDDMGDLICVGQALSADTVLQAYRLGCFPWTGEPPIPWYSPNPRLVLYPAQFHASANLQKLARRGTYTVCFDHAFAEVMQGCATSVRPGQTDTWITENMCRVYHELFTHGIGHSVEVYRDTKLVGGLYGLAMGDVFFGESMFHAEADTSKLALFALCRLLQARGYAFIDCQQVTAHLMSLGARPVHRPTYLAKLDRALATERPAGSWRNLSAPF